MTDFDKYSRTAESTITLGGELMRARRNWVKTSEALSDGAWNKFRLGREVAQPYGCSAAYVFCRSGQA